MKIIPHWRIIILLLLAIWAVFLIHPFSREAAVVSYVEAPASGIIHQGDLVNTINGYSITNSEDFDNIVSELIPNEPVEITILRETFPYTYKTEKHVYLSGEKNNRTYISVLTRDNQFSYLALSHELVGGNKFILTSESPREDAAVIARRINVGQMRDYSIKTEGNNIYILTTHGKEIEKFISVPGKFEARIGETLFFNSDDVHKMCTSGVECVLRTYPHYSEESGVSEIVWRYDFEIRLSNEAANRFVSLVDDLVIGSCDGDICYLNETIDYYIDDVLFGKEKIPSIIKDEPYFTPLVGGDVHTIDPKDARDTRYFVQAVMQGDLNAEYVGSEKISPSLNIPYLTLIIFAIATMITSSLIVFARIKNPITALTAFGISGLQFLTVIGILAGLNVLVTPITLFVIFSLPLVNLLFYNFIVHRAKKDRLIQKKINNFSKKLDWNLFLTVVVLFVLNLIYAKLFVPVLIYVLLEIVFSKTTFIRSIKTRH